MNIWPCQSVRSLFSSQRMLLRIPRVDEAARPISDTSQPLSQVELSSRRTYPPRCSLCRRALLQREYHIFKADCHSTGGPGNKLAGSATPYLSNNVTLLVIHKLGISNPKNAASCCASTDARSKPTRRVSLIEMLHLSCHTELV